MSGGFDIARCSSCGATVIWTDTLAGKRMPVDSVPSAKGTLVLEAKPGKAPLSAAASAATASTERAMGRLYTSHFATCPNAAKHRKPKTKERV